MFRMLIAGATFAVLAALTAPPPTNAATAAPGATTADVEAATTDSTALPGLDDVGSEIVRADRSRRPGTFVDPARLSTSTNRVV